MIKGAFNFAWIEGHELSGEEFGYTCSPLSDRNTTVWDYVELLGKMTREEEMTKTEAGREGRWSAILRNPYVKDVLLHHMVLFFFPYLVNKVYSTELNLT